MIKNLNKTKVDDGAARKNPTTDSYGDSWERIFWKKDEKVGEEDKENNAKKSSVSE